MPFFSVIISIYNKSNYLSACLKSVLHQSYTDFEIIIVNDGSTDDSVKKVEAFNSEKIKLYHQKNQGVSQARNNAVNLSTGIYMAFLDADDIWSEMHLKNLKESIDAFSDAGLYANNYNILYSDVFTAPAKLNINLEYNYPIIVRDFFKASLKDTLAWTSATAIKKEIFLAFGGFNPKYMSGEDLDLWIRIALKSYVVFNPKISMIYNKSITNSLSKSECNEQRYILYHSFSVDEISNSSLKQYLDIKRYGLALRTKINGEIEIYKKTLKNIDFSNLNTKQSCLLKTPAFLLRILNRIRPYGIKNIFYLKLFKS